jgi:SSS family solute:Na+ symporter
VEAGLDILVLLAYFVSLFAIGLFFARKQTSREMYFLDGRRIPWFIAGASVFASLLSTISYLAIPGEMLRYGVGQFTHLFAFVLIIPVMNSFIIPTLMSLSDTCVYDYLERRFSPATRMLGVVVFIVMRLIWMGLILYTGCLAISQMTGWSMVSLVLLMGCVTILYTTLGGMSAVVWSDFMQFIVLFGGAIPIPVYIAWSTGTGPAEWLALFSRAERTHVPTTSTLRTVFSHWP